MDNEIMAAKKYANTITIDSIEGKKKLANAITNAIPLSETKGEFFPLTDIFQKAGWSNLSKSDTVDTYLCSDDKVYFSQSSGIAGDALMFAELFGGNFDGVEVAYVEKTTAKGTTIKRLVIK